jgi:branched-chain amino acid aminotransferase
MLQSYDPRNEKIFIYVKDKLYPRNEAKVSVFDSVVQGGDAVWEGLRVYNNRIFCLDKHLERLLNSAKALDFKKIPTRKLIKAALFATLRANNMTDGVHIRLTLTRGEKITSGMDPRLNQFGCCLIVLAEWKKPVYDNEGGIRAICSSIRRNNPNHLDSKIHHNNLLNNILAKIEANVAGVDAALMLDIHGYASELNGANIFIVKKGQVLTPLADSCLPGITRKLVLEISEEEKIPVIEKNISATEIYTADEAFASGTMGELTPIIELDGRKINCPESGSVFNQIKSTFKTKTAFWGEEIPL